MKNKLFILFDGRSCGNAGTERSAVLTTGHTLKEVVKDSKDYTSGAIYSYDIVEGNKIINEKWEQDT